MKKYSPFAPAPLRKPKPCGTILPTADSLAVNDRWHMTNEQARRKVAVLAGLTNPQVVGLEVRYYASPNKYAIVSSRTFQVLWFHVTSEGDFSEKAFQLRNVKNKKP